MSRAAAAVKPIHLPSFETIPEHYSIHEQPPSSWAGPSPGRHATATAAAYPMYPGLQTPTADRSRTKDSMPAALNRPRRLSGGVNSSLSTVRSRESPNARMRNPSWSAMPNTHAAEFADASGWRSSTVVPQRPSPIKHLRTKARPDDMLSLLPDEVFEVILDMLKELHLDGGRSESCATCWMRDACSVALSSRKCLRAARRTLYEDIVLVGPDSQAHKKRFKLTQGSRMVMLRRTLRGSPNLANHVRSLKVPLPEATLTAAVSSTSRGPSPLDQYEDSVAALVMACPNLERLSGPIFTYNHSFRRLFHALSTRTKLKDMTWFVEPSRDALSNQSLESLTQCELPTPARLTPAQEFTFLEQHRQWTKLSSLAIHCLPDASLGPDTLLARTLTVLPSLQHLHLSGLPANAFSDTNLLSLPRLKSLTLSNIAGISSNGLSSFATRANSRPLEKLTLRHVPLTSLPAMARILSMLTSLNSFSFVQSFPPLMPETDSFILWMMPYLASSSVSELHWDITSHRSCANAADDILARSIAAGGFPALRSLRAPNDPEGIFQGLCRPVDRIDLPGDRFRTISPSTGSLSTPSSPTKHLVKSPTTSSLPGMLSSVPSPCTNLHRARLAAQARIDGAREESEGAATAFRFRVTVQDEDGSLVDEFGLGRYVGTVGSVIELNLQPDPGSSDDKGGLVDVTDLASDVGEGLAGGRTGCDGSWNWREGVVADRREKETWWHTERGRWTRVSLE
ncbi:RNI-like protein [Purpureocillium lavendulum]|uniref:RNI-like protein n=1 Tax=Purpureocillium lavendulum TaxID=1247861 RepID=A0AB34G3B0_9HYPO|nr:RNI-like protein [Purpureocillium lavendulum]